MTIRLYLRALKHAEADRQTEEKTNRSHKRIPIMLKSL